MISAPQTDEHLAGDRPEREAPRAPELRSIFDEHVDHVGNSLRRLGVRDADVPDLTQEVFVVIHRILPDYDPSRPMWPWIFGIAYRVAAAYRRKALRHVLDSGSMLAARADSSPDVTAEIAQQQRRELVHEALESIAFSRRAVFVMAELDGIAVPEIARALDIGVNTAYSRLRLARAEFEAAAKRLIAQRGAP